MATLVAAAVAGETPGSIADRPIGLLHAQRAAQALLDGLDGSGVSEPVPYETSVLGVWEALAEFRSIYTGSDVPDVSDDFRLDLFNTYRAGLFPARYPLSLTPRGDQRGRLVESIRSHGSGGQVFVSTTNEGFTRGEHFHLRKIERFVVLAGRAEIALRKMCTNEVVSFVVSGDDPVAIDMPTMWTHNITALDGEATTLFWTNELYDPDHPDTYWRTSASNRRLGVLGADGFHGGLVSSCPYRIHLVRPRNFNMGTDTGLKRQAGSGPDGG